MGENTDPAVAAALRTLEPPPPRPGFWDELVDRLAQESPAGRRAPRWSRSRRWALTGLAVAACAIAVLALLGTPPDRLTVVDPAEEGTATPTAAPSAAERAEDAARQWIRAVGDGDVEGAWALVGPQSRESIGGKAAFDQLMLSDLPEGWGAWAGAESLDVRAFPLTGDAWVVALDGIVTQEGDTLRRTVALGARVGAESVQVEPFTDRSEGLVAIGPEAVVAPGAPLGVNVDAEAAAFVVALDGVAVTEEALDRADGAIRAVRPAPPLASGLHSLVVAYVTPSGSIAVDALTFRVT